jgi:uncharacterized protein (DUF1778 family)
MWRHNGAMTTSSKPATVRDLDRINLRLSAETFALIDAARETSANDRHGEGRVANG